jgi:hypothetical protein
MHFLWGGSGEPFATVVNSVVDPHWLQCGSRAVSSFHLIADLDPRELNPDPFKKKEKNCNTKSWSGSRSGYETLVPGTQHYIDKRTLSNYLELNKETENPTNFTSSYVLHLGPICAD